MVDQNFNCLNDLPLDQKSGDEYRVSTDVYAGPLDLLLELIEKAELDITTLSLAQVTDQYLEHLKNMVNRDPAEISEFLVIAARLVQIKSSVLLPRPVLTDLEEEKELDPGEALAQQLIQYKRFKEISVFLKEREDSGMHTYLHIATPPNYEPKLDMSDVTLDLLIKAARSAFSVTKSLPELSQVMNKPLITIRQKINTFIRLLKKHQNINFDAVLQNNTRLEIVVTFLAMLELIKRNFVEVNQVYPFGEIQIQSLDEWIENEDIELEFTDS